MEMTVNQQAELRENIHRREVRLVGTPHDVSRMMEACKRALRQAEQNGNLTDDVVIHAPAPQENEQ